VITLSTRARRALVAGLVAIGCAGGAFVAAEGASATALCPGTMAQTDSDPADIGCYLFYLVNQERAANHVPQLYSVSQLRLSAQRHDGYMARYNTLSHQLPGEPALLTRFAQAGFTPCVAGGENIAWNSDRTWRGAQYVENLMYNESGSDIGHRLNILNPHFNRLGVTVLMDTAHNKMWITFDFGQT